MKESGLKVHSEGKILDPYQSSSSDGIDRRGFLKCMAWAGTGVVWSFIGGVPVSRAFGSAMRSQKQEDFTFVQISDSHIGFNKPANADVTGTLQSAVNKILAIPKSPDFLIHTGDLTHSSKPGEFDTVDQVLTGAKRQIFYVPGEHDTSVDDGKSYLDRYGKGSSGNGWYSFDHKGVHFIGLVNVVQLEGMGKLGQAQLDWLKNDLSPHKNSTANRALRAHSALGCISRLGMGHIGQRASLFLPQTIRLRHGAQRAHSSGDAKGGGQRNISHCDVDGLPSTCSGRCAIAWSNESTCREAA